MFFLSFFNIFAFLRFCDNYHFLFLRVKCMDLDLKKRKKKKEIRGIYVVGHLGFGELELC